jgi:hypothetical protein
VNESLDELLARASGCLDAEHGALWTFGDIVNAAVDNARPQCTNPRTLRKARASIYRTFASLRKSVTAAFVRQHAERAGTFGMELRYPDVSFSFYRAVIGAAKRTECDPRELLDDALARAMSVSDLNALGVAPKAETGLREQCGDCGAHVVITVKQDKGRSFAGLVVSCPLCAALKLNDGGDPREASRVGVMA